jgi:hypothetical protein
MTTQPNPTTEAMVKSLAIALRDKYVADARQAMKMARAIERQYPDIAKLGGKER